MTSIGIDPSINSTGMCVLRCDRGNPDTFETNYYILAPSITKSTSKWLDNHQEKFSWVAYEKKDLKLAEDYSERENLKSENLIEASRALDEILMLECPDIAVMEGISYGSTSGASIVDLAGLNFLYREKLIESSYTGFLVIASPMEIKKFATGNGGVDKEVMLKVWKLCECLDIDPKAKLDDLADAYFMALYGMQKLYPDLGKSFELPKVEIPKKAKTKKLSEETQSAIETFNGIA